MNLCKELKGINWSQYIDESALLRLPPGQTAPGFTVGRPYYLGFGNVNYILVHQIKEMAINRFFFLILLAKLCLSDVRYSKRRTR